MAAVSSVASSRFLPHSAPAKNGTHRPRSSHRLPCNGEPSFLSRRRKRPLAATAAALAAEDLDVIPVRSADSTDQDGVVVRASDDDVVNAGGATHVGGFAFESGVGGSGSGGGGGGGFGPSPSSSSSPMMGPEGEDLNRMIDRAINAAGVLAAGTFAITKLLTIDETPLDLEAVARPAAS